MNTLYPIFLKLENKPILVVGGGKVSEQKIKGLLDVNANVTVVSPQVTEWIDTLVSEKKITLWRREYLENDVEGFFLVFAATNNPVVHQQIFNDAASHNIPVNVVDVPDLCNFYLASIFHDGDLKIAVSTNGKSPTLGKIIRGRIAEEFGKNYPELLNRLSEIRPYVHSAFIEADKRKEVLEKIVDDELKKINDGRLSLTPTCQKAGKVLLVGAGPGDPELISVKGLRAIQNADVILYDALIQKELLLNARRDCELINVGKRSGKHSVSQEEINGILVVKAKEGKVVVRLKGGDPFIFGRGGEETEALRHEGINTEIIPGITAGIGIPSSLGISLTKRGYSSNVVFVTGNEQSGKESEIAWQKISAIDTIVVYMGIKNIRHIVKNLIGAGRFPETSAVVIFGGTTPEEIVVRGTLNTIADDVERVITDAPGIIVIGDVAGFIELHAQTKLASEIENLR
jgi:uroporphyrin-III C-methyltransferase / precorrin-2 dehydrogenase / sirohydrochlorin ferrochelatase